jgi:hypothetical protein
MATTERTVFFDESGFTGPNLSDPDQPYFVYAGVLIEPDEARHLLGDWVNKHGIPLGANGEVKGSSLITSRNPRRREAVVSLLSDLASRTWVAIFEKRFCLAAKFFDYVFDPILLPKIGMFHGLKFAHFLANLLLLYTPKDQDVATLLGEFADLANGKDDRFGAGLPLDLDLRNATDCIKAIVSTHLPVVREHTREARELAFGKWLLDLTSSALFGLLMNIGNDTPLRVICDESKPLAADLSVFDNLIGNPTGTEAVSINDMKLVTVSLAGPVAPRKSHLEPGLQLADVVAASVGNVLKSQDKGQSAAFAEALDAGHTSWVKTDRSHVDLRQHIPQINLSLLMLLAQRSVRGMDLFEDIEEFAVTREFRPIVTD